MLLTADETLAGRLRIVRLALEMLELMLCWMLRPMPVNVALDDCTDLLILETALLAVVCILLSDLLKLALSSVALTLICPTIVVLLAICLLV